jgi:hypothetical protein
MAAEAVRLIHHHPRRWRNWGPGREPGPVREEAGKALAAEARVANERHAWIGEAMQEPGTGQAPGAGCETAAGT